MGIETTVKNDISWLKAHETLIIVAMVLASGVYLVNKHLNNRAAETQTAYQAAKEQLDEARQDALRATTDYKAALDTAQKQNVALIATMAQRQVVLVKQQEAVKTLPLPEVATQWQQEIGGQSDISAEVDGLKINDSGARRTLTALLSIPTLEADKRDLQTEVTNTQAALESADSLIKTQVTEIEAQDTTCKAQGCVFQEQT